MAVGCSSAATSGETTDAAAAAPQDASAPRDAVASAHDADPLPDVAVAQNDASATSDAGPLAAQPSPGAVACGEGTFSVADALAFCQSPPSDASGPLPARCDAVSTTGGRYEVWCSPSATEIFVWFDALRSTGKLQDCYGSSLFMLGTGEYRFGASPSLGGNGLQTMGYPTSSIDANGTTDVRAKLVLGAQPQGSVRVWLTAMLQSGGCGGAILGPPTVIAGAEVKWSMP